MDGTSGALYAIYMNSLVTALRQAPPGKATTKVWGAALRQASEALKRYTPARPGDRTLVDALEPFVQTLIESGNLKKAAEASRKGAESTKGMKASLGRTVYVGGTGFEQVPDPGVSDLRGVEYSLFEIPISDRFICNSARQSLTLLSIGLGSV